MTPSSLRITVLLAAAALCAGLALSRPAPARAADLDDFIALQVKEKVMLGREDPVLHIEARQALAGLTLTLRADKARHTFEIGRLRRGARRDISWKQPEGRLEWRAHLVARLRGGRRATFDFTFTTEVVGPPKLRVDKHDVDLRGKCVRANLNRPIAKIELTVLADGGKQVDRVDRDLTGTATSERICWQHSGEVLEILDLKVTDRHGFWVGIRVIPFEVQIPHDDVIFETASSAIPPSEEPKLRATLATLQDALRKHGKLIQLELYVAGYTDTVGSERDNIVLSEKRARAIGRWFRKAGVRVPIYTQGFGEAVLAVNTGDEVDEPRNRRALYILSKGPPSGPSIPRQNWKPL